jgi:hypothetical protein
LNEDLEECRCRVTFVELLLRLGLDKSVGPKADGTGSAHCPRSERHKHGDKNKSFEVKWSSRTGRCYGKCYAGCGRIDDVELIKGHFNLATFGDALEKYCELAGVVHSADVLPEWDECDSALSGEPLKKIAAWRVLSLEFLARFKKERRIGWYKGCVAFPVIDNAGKLVAIHCCRPHSKKWFYQPKGQKVWPFIIGELAGPGYVIAAESTWDALAYLDLSGETGGVVSSRGKEFGSRTAEALEPGKTVYALMQNDEECEYWLQTLCAPGKLTVKAVRFPEKFNDVEKIHDLNDFRRAGATPDDLWRAMTAAEIVATPILQNNDAPPPPAGESSGPNGTVDLASEVSPRVEIVEPEDEEESLPPFPVEYCGPIVRRTAQGISDLVGVPLSMTAPMILSILGASIGKGLELNTNLFGRIARANTFTLVCKSSGSGGSQCYRLVVAPFMGVQQTLRREFKAREHTISAEIKRLTVRVKSLETEMKQLKNSSDEKVNEMAEVLAKLEKEQKKRHPLLLVTDITSEKLGELMVEYGETLAHLDSDAADALAIISGERYGRNTGYSSTAIWVKGYTGDYHSQHRKNGPPIELESPCLNVLFLTTPDVVRKLFSVSRFTSNGLLPRFLSCDPRAQPVSYTEENAGKQVLPSRISESYESWIFSLVNCYRLPPQQGTEPYRVELSKGAHELLTKDWNEFCAGHTGDERPYESRHTENLSRLSLQLHSDWTTVQEELSDISWHSKCHAHEQPLTEQTMYGALQIRNWFNGQQDWLRAPQRVDMENKLWEKMEALLRDHPRRGSNAGVMRRDLYRNRRVCSSKEIAEQLLQSWLNKGKICPIERPTTSAGGRPTTAYVLGPLN